MSDFIKEKMSQLSSERETVAQEANTATPEEPVGDPEGEDGLGDLDSTDDVDATLDPDSEATGDPEDGEEANTDPEYMELQEKYKSLEAEFSRVTANRKEIEASLDNAKAQSVQYQHQLEDEYNKAKAFVDQFAGMANQQLQQLQQVNPSQLTQEQYAQYQQYYQQAQAQHSQYQQMAQAIDQHLKEAKEATLKREAEIARERLKTRIPDWNGEKYKALGELASEYGYSPDEFFNSTDYRMMLLLNEVKTSRDAAQAVETRSKQTKTNPPKNRSSRTPDRNSKGQFTNAQKEFYSSPAANKGSFAAMKAAQLRMEREKNR